MPLRYITEELFVWKRFYKKTLQGGFRGRATASTKKIVLGMLELDLSTHKATGCLKFPFFFRSTLLLVAWSFLTSFVSAL